MTQYDPERRIIYQLRFEDHPELDSRDFRSVKLYKVDDDLGDFREGLGSVNSRWRVRDIFIAPDGESDILFCEEIVLA